MGGGRAGGGVMEGCRQMHRLPAFSSVFPSTRHTRERRQGGWARPLRSRAELLSTEVTCLLGHDR